MRLEDIKDPKQRALFEAALNGHKAHEINTENKRTHPKPQRAIRHEPLAAGKAQEENSRRDQRFHITIISYRTRLLDEDNPCPKYHIDGLRYCKIIPDDCPDKVSIQIRQVRVKTKEEEETVIIIDALP